MYIPGEDRMLRPKIEIIISILIKLITPGSEQREGSLSSLSDTASQVCTCTIKQLEWTHSVNRRLTTCAAGGNALHPDISPAGGGND